MKRLIFLMLCMLPWLAYSQNEQTSQEQLVSLMKNYYHSDINNIQALLDAGASFDVKDEYGRTPIFYLRNPALDLAKLLEVYPINLTVSDNNGYTVYEYLLKNPTVLGHNLWHDSEDGLEFMNLMEQYNAIYDSSKILFFDKYFPCDFWGTWPNRYIGKTIPEIKQMIYRDKTIWGRIINYIRVAIEDTYCDFKEWIDNILSKINEFLETVQDPVFWIKIFLFIIFFPLAVVFISKVTYTIWLVFSGCWFKIMDDKIKQTKELTDKKSDQQDQNIPK